MKRKNYRRFNLVFMPLAVLNILSIALFNLVVDPYEVLSSLNNSNAEQPKLESEKSSSVTIPPPKSINKPVVKTTPQTTLMQRSQYRAERFKLNLDRLSITRINPKTILLGTSTALRLSTKHPALTQQPVYNLGLAGAKMHDIRIYFEDILANHPELKEVVIGLDFYSFGGQKQQVYTQEHITTTNPITDESSTKPTTEVRRNKYSISLQDLIKMNFSLDTLNVSINKLMKKSKSIASKPIGKNSAEQASKKAKLSNAAPSELNYLHLDLNINVNDVNSVKPATKNIKFVKPADKNTKSVKPATKNAKLLKQAVKNVNPVKKIAQLNNSKKLFQFHRVIDSYYKEKTFYKSYSLSQGELNNLKAILDTCKKKKITIKVFFSPIHAAQLETIYTAGLWSDFEEWKRQVIAMTPVWDFTEYNSITTEPINDDMENFVDSVHYDEQIGILILNRIYNYHKERVPSNFGFLVTPTNLESQLAKIRDERQAWLKTNQATVQFVQDIKKQANSK